MADAERMRESFVYRFVPEGSIPATTSAGNAEAVFIDDFKDILANAAPLRRLFGNRGLLKALLKVTTGRRFLCAFVMDGRVVTHVWATTLGRLYSIESDACVLGPLRTEPDMRKKGLATAVLRNAVCFLRGRGYRVFYIDTLKTNIASQRTILRAGFGPPFAVLHDGEFVKIERIA